MAWLLDTCAWIQHLKNPGARLSGGSASSRLRKSCSARW